MPSRRIVIISVLAIPVLAMAWWLGSPLFLDRTVNEEFPNSATAVVPDSMTHEEVEETMAALADESQSAEDPMPEAGAPVALFSGEFEDADRAHRGSGTATIYELEDGGLVLRFEDFEVTNGPDLRVLLAGHEGPSDRSELDGDGYIELDSLKGNVGNQNYEIPGNYDLEDLGSVVIYCSPFHVIFSVAPLDDVRD